MATTNALVRAPAAAKAPGCRISHQPARSWLAGRRGLVIAGLLIVSLVALAVSQSWLAAATLLPLLFILPCAAMLLMCMKGMNHGQQPSAVQVESRDSGSVTDTRT
jgi:hypothetical protein